MQQYLCHVGHRFSPEALQSLGLEHLDRTLWGAVRSLQENAMLRRRMAARARQRGLSTLAEEWQAQARMADGNVAELRTLVEAIVPPALADQAPLSSSRGRREGGDNPRNLKQAAPKPARKRKTVRPRKRQGRQSASGAPGRARK